MRRELTERQVGLLWVYNIRPTSLSKSELKEVKDIIYGS